MYLRVRKLSFLIIILEQHNSRVFFIKFEPSSTRKHAVTSGGDTLFGVFQRVKDLHPLPSITVVAVIGGWFVECWVVFSLNKSELFDLGSTDHISFVFGFRTSFSLSKRYDRCLFYVWSSQPIKDRFGIFQYGSIMQPRRLLWGFYFHAFLVLHSNTIPNDSGISLCNGDNT